MISRYQIQEPINQGGVGVVYRAWDTRLQRTVAIKRFLAPELRSDGGAIDPDLMREATVLSAMQHPNIVSIYDVIPDDPEGPCVVMEFLNGKDLEQAVSEAAMVLDDFYQVAEQTLNALSNAHRLNLLHRDIKPANIQVTWLADGGFICKFVDFGLARFFKVPSKQTVRPDGTVMGSVYYMAPEQLERRPLDGRTDLYSLGCVFYYLLSMQRPFVGQTVQHVITGHLNGACQPLQYYRPQFPPALCQWVHWLMQRHPENRPADANEALSVLRRIRQGQAPGWPSSMFRQTRPVPDPAIGKKNTALKPPRQQERRKPRPLRYIIPAMGTAALFSVSLVAWQHWQATNAAYAADPPVHAATASSILAAARTAAAAANTTAQVPAKSIPAPPTQITAPVVDNR